MSSIQHFKYSKKQLNYSLFFGLLWILIFILYSIFKTDSYFGYAYLAIGIVILIIYFYKKTYHYATIKNGILTTHDFLPKSISLDEITDVHYFSGKYKLMTKKSEFDINTMVMDKSSVENLKRIINQLKFSKS